MLVPIRRMVAMALLCLGAQGPVLAQVPAKPLVHTEATLFGKGKPAPRCVWTGAAEDGTRKTIELRMVDGVRLRGWAVNATDANAPFVLTFHGAGQTIEDAVCLARDAFFYSRLNFNLITFDYRGGGFSEGDVSLPSALADSLAVYDEVSRRAGGRPVFVCGWSMGSIFASHVAARRPSVAGLILLAPIASGATMKADLLRLHNIDLQWPSDFQSIDNEAELRRFHQPLLIVHGTEDRVVPYPQGRRDFKAAGSRDKTFVTVKGKGHRGTIQSIEADNAIAAFMARHGARAQALN